MKRHTPEIHSSYLDRFLDTMQLCEIIKLAVKKLHGKQFEAFAFRGMSGALLAPPLALKMKKTLIMVRKPGQCHTDRTVEGDAAAERYIIVDDFVSTGETIRTIVEEVTKAFPRATCIGLLKLRDIGRCDYGESFLPIEQLRRRYGVK